MDLKLHFLINFEVIIYFLLINALTFQVLTLLIQAGEFLCSETSIMYYYSTGVTSQLFKSTRYKENGTNSTTAYARTHLMQCVCCNV